MMEKLRLTPSQTIGPYFAYGLTAVQYGYEFTSIINNSLVNETKEDDLIYITGNVFDGDGKTIHDAMIELWHTDKQGNYVKGYVEVPITEIPFKGLGRYGTGTDSEQRFLFKTTKPGMIKGQAPHINVILFMRGSLNVLYTRIYFDDEQNSSDPLLLLVNPERRSTLIAKKELKEGKTFYHFNIYMQGERETVFLDI
jgi:protocatechuate 3,4-dioxygenase alpha subunit